MTIAVVGLGRMGTAMARRLIERGLSVTGWDIDPAAVARVVGDGVATASSVRAAAAAADVVLTSVTEDGGVRELFRGPDGTLRKDIMSAVASGARNGVPMPLASGTLAALTAAVGAGHGTADIAEIPAFFREDAIQRWDSPATD